MTPDERTDSVEIAGRRFAWRALGSGPPLLLVNGYGGTAADWDPGFVGELADGFEVLCPDNRGMDRSELGEPAEVTIDAMATDLVAMMDSRGIERAPVVGWSMGGFVAQALARLVPERVASLVLLSTDPGGPGAIPAEAETWARLVDHSGTPREQATRTIELLFPPEVAAVVDCDFGEVVAQARAALSGAALSAQEAAMRAWHSREQPPPPEQCPQVLAACGAEDVVIPPANTELLARLWPDARAQTFAGGGHAFMAQQPAPLADLIKSFVRG